MNFFLSNYWKNYKGIPIIASIESNFSKIDSVDKKKRKRDIKIKNCNLNY